jgi:nickel/cobalt transporter (NicO) family protein
MRELLFFVASSFWAGAAHAATPGHGKTIAAAYIVGARGKPIDAVILGIFVTLSHTSGIVLVCSPRSARPGCGRSASKPTWRSPSASL